MPEKENLPVLFPALDDTPDFGQNDIEDEAIKALFLADVCGGMSAKVRSWHHVMKPSTNIERVLPKTESVKELLALHEEITSLMKRNFDLKQALQSLEVKEKEFKKKAEAAQCEIAELKSELKRKDQEIIKEQKIALSSSARLQETKEAEAAMRKQYELSSSRSLETVQTIVSLREQLRVQRRSVQCKGCATTLEEPFWCFACFAKVGKP